MATAAETLAANAAITAQINAKTDEYEDLAEANLQDLLSIAADTLGTRLGRTSSSIDKAREISLGALGDLPEARPEVVVPPFVFNPEDFMTTDLLKKYSYDSTFFDFLDPILQTYITSETAFIDQTVQDALFAQTHERDIQIQNDQLDMVARQQAHRGFSYPTSMTTAAQNEVIKQYGDRRSDRNSEITGVIAERAQESRLRAMSTGVEMESIRSQFQLGYGQLYMRSAEYLVRKYQVDVESEVARVNTELEQIRIKAHIDETMVGSDANWTTSRLQHTQQTIDQLLQDAKNELETQKTQATMQMAAVTKVIDFYKDIHAGYTGQMNGVNLVT